MDQNLVEAALSGNVGFLIEALATCRNNTRDDDGNQARTDDFHHVYERRFLSQHQPQRQDIQQAAGNILHLAASNGQDKFIQEAIQKLPVSLIHSLLIQTEPKKQTNPLHVAAEKGHLGVVKLIMSFYEQNQARVFNSKPWLEPDKSQMTPLHTALSRGWDECGLKMVSMLVDAKELEQICNMLDKDGNSPLYLAIKKGCDQVVLRFLRSVPSYSLRAKEGSTPLHFVTNCSEEVFRLLLEKHPSYIEEINLKVICKWAERGKLWPLEYLLKNVEDNDPKRNDLIDLIYQTNHLGNNVFHTSARRCKREVARTLANIHRDQRAKKSIPSSPPDVPWLVSNKKNETPIGLAMKYYGEETYDEYCQLSKEVDMEHVRKGKSELLFLAIQKKKYHAAKGIWNIRQEVGWSLYPQGWKEIWNESLRFSEEVAIWVTERLLSSTSNANEIIAYTLPLVSDVGSARVLVSILKTNYDALKLAPRAWVEACKKGHFLTVMAFIENCHNFRQICLKEKDTPLHHIQFEEHKQYVNMLKNPVIFGLKNFQDRDGQTPLHKAIRNRNLVFAQELLTTDGVIRNIKNKKNKTAMDLLIEPCKESWEWDEMCKRLGIVPGLKMTYFQDKTNSLEIRNTLSVVAALLATITFTAGFTLPGGVKSDSTGKATLANNGAFIVFLLADALAMCSSMLVLVCLIWSMICDYHKALLLIDKSVIVLMLALCSTLVAFMTGVYVVIPHKSLWTAIVVLVMCSLSIILSEGTIIDKLATKLCPALHRRYKDEMQAMEQGEAGTS